MPWLKIAVILNSDICVSGPERSRAPGSLVPTVHKPQDPASGIVRQKARRPMAGGTHRAIKGFDLGFFAGVPFRQSGRNRTSFLFIGHGHSHSDDI